MADWRQDPKILEIKALYDAQGATPDVIAALRQEVPAARLRNWAGEEYGSVHSALIAAGSEFERLGEGAQMIFADLMDDEEMRRSAERRREMRERTMRPLEEARPVATAVGEMLPSMALPGGMAGGLGRRLATAGLSAGGYEYGATGGELGQTAIAGAMGAGGSEVGRLMGRWLLGPGRMDVPSPDLTGSPSHRKMMAEAEQLGMNVTPAARTGNPVLEQVEASLSRSPYFSGPFFEAMAKNDKLANRMAREAIGLKGDDLITDDVLNARHAALGEQFEEIVGEDKFFPISTDFATAIDDVTKEYMRGVTRNAETRKILANVRDMSDDQFMSVRDYQQIASDLAYQARTTAKDDAPGGRALYAARQALDDQFDAEFGDLERLQENRRYWRRLRQIEESKAILKGQFRPIQFAKYLRGPREGKGRVRDEEPIARMGVIGEYIANAIANSGTPTGQAIPDFFNAPLWQKSIMLGGGGISNAYMNAPWLMMGPGGYLPPALSQPLYQGPRFWQQYSSPGQLFTDALQRGGRAQGIEAAQGQGLLGGLL